MYFVSDAGGGWNVRVRLQAKAGGAMGCAIATTRHDAADDQAAERDGVWQYLRLGIGRHGVAVIVLHVHEALSLRRCVEARLSSHAHAHAAPKVATLTADTTFSTRGRRVTDHTVACTSPLTHCPGYCRPVFTLDRYQSGIDHSLIDLGSGMVKWY